MTDKHKPLVQLIVQAIAAREESEDKLPSDADLQLISTQLWPLVREQAKKVMLGKPGGLNLPEAGDLAAAGILYFIKPPNPGVLKFKGANEGGLTKFVATTLENMRIDDVRALLGRQPKPKKQKPTEAEAEPQEDVVTGGADMNQETSLLTKEQRKIKVKTSPNLPRVFVDVMTEEGDEYLPSDRRSATGYLLLKQTKSHLHDYLALFPGSSVKVPYGPKSKKEGSRKISLTVNHAKLLRVWMSGEGFDQWSDIAQEMGASTGTVKRWWAEAVAAFLLDTSPQAQTLRSLYRINAEHTQLAAETADETTSEEVVVEHDKPANPDGLHTAAA